MILGPKKCNKLSLWGFAGLRLPAKDFPFKIINCLIWAGFEFSGLGFPAPYILSDCRLKVVSNAY